MILRMLDVQRELADVSQSSVPVVIASEYPVERWDENTGQVVSEILRMDGMRFRGKRNQLPIVDSHNYDTVRHVLGSVRNIRVEGSQLVGDAVFAKDANSQEAYSKLMDGHLTDFSITARTRQAKSVKRGENIDGIQGPAVIVTEWIPSDASLVAAGADETSTVRNVLRSYYDLKEIKRMLSEQLKTALVAKGMPEQIDDMEQALTWAIGLMTDPSQVAMEAEIPAAPMPEAVVENMDMPAGEPVKEEEVKDAVSRALKADVKRQREIRAICEQAKLSRAFADSLCDDQVTLEIAREKVLTKMIERGGQPVGASTDVRITKQTEGRDLLLRDIGTGLLQRSYTAAGVSKRVDNISEDARYFAGAGLQQLADEILRADGINTMRIAPRDRALVAMGHRATIERLRDANIIRDAYHTTGSFANLMLNVANKTLQAGYEEAEYTWSIWARQAPSVADFKSINRIRFSESPDLKHVAEREDYKESKMSDSKESYSVEKYGAVFTVSWETIVNDDLDAISRIPQMHGNAARRTQNKKVYEVLTSNPTMGDGVALFGSHTSGTNLSGSSSSPSVDNLNTVYTGMMLQKGLSSDVVLGLRPRYLIVPAALSATAEELVSSVSYAKANNNSSVQNLYGVGGTRPLTVVVEPNLDSNSQTAWYAAAANTQIDTVELSFLQGEEQPQLDTEWGFDNDTYKYKVRQTFGVKAIDWRGLYKFATS